MGNFVVNRDTSAEYVESSFKIREEKKDYK